MNDSTAKLEYKGKSLELKPIDHRHANIRYDAIDLREGFCRKEGSCVLEEMNGVASDL